MVEQLDGCAEGERDGGDGLEDDDARSEGGGERDKRGGWAEDGADGEVLHGGGGERGEVERGVGASGGPGGGAVVDFDC